jgi:hypothetical protein
MARLELTSRPVQGSLDNGHPKMTSLSVVVVAFDHPNIASKVSRWLGLAYACGESSESMAIFAVGRYPARFVRASGSWALMF